MDLSSLDAIYYLLAFVVPGFIWNSVLSIFQPRRTENTELSIIKFLTLSIYNYAVWSWLIYLLTFNAWLKESQIISAVAWFTIIFLSPIILGIVAGYNSQRNWVRKFLHAVGLRPIHVMPTAWERRFDETNKPHWVLIALKQGQTVAGYYGLNSYASSESSKRDIYIEQIYQVDNTGQWKIMGLGHGILINSDEIRFVEMWPVT